MAGLGAGGGVWDRVAAGLQQRVCRWWRGGVSPWVRGGGSCSATLGITEVLNLLVELVTFDFKCPPQLLEPLDFTLKCLKVTITHRFLETKHTHTMCYIVQKSVFWVNFFDWTLAIRDN